MSKRLVDGDMEDLVHLSHFIEIGKAISHTKSIEATLNEVMRHIGDIFTPLNWSLFLVDQATGELCFNVAIGKSATLLQGKRLPRGEGIAGWIVEHGQAVIVEDVSKDPRFSARIDHYTGFTTQSIIGVPLRIEEKVFGAIELINKINGDNFTPFELKILTTIADFAAIAIEKAYYLRALKKMAATDQLTGVFNRRSLEKLLDREAALCARYKTPLSLLMVDIDRFKKINDTFGHLAGDAVLKALAAILTNNARKVDSVCRYGGDEFVVILPNTPQDKAEAARQRILDAIAYHNSLHPELPFQATVGLHSMESGDPSSIFHFLDTDLYRQKDLRSPQNLESIVDNLQSMLAEEKDLFFNQGGNTKE